MHPVCSGPDPGQLRFLANSFGPPGRHSPAARLVSLLFPAWSGRSGALVVCSSASSGPSEAHWPCPLVPPPPKLHILGILLSCPHDRTRPMHHAACIAGRGQRTNGNGGGGGVDGGHNASRTGPGLDPSRRLVMTIPRAHRLSAAVYEPGRRPLSIAANHSLQTWSPSRISSRPDGANHPDQDLH